MAANCNGSYTAATACGKCVGCVDTFAEECAQHSVEDIFAIAAAAELRVNNLFQCEDRMWQANMWEWKGDAHDYGKGATPVEALLRALNATKRRVPVKPVTEDAVGSDLV